MTKEKFIEIIKNDPRFKLSGKSAVVNLWTSPFSDVTYDDRTDTTTYVLDGESITLTADELQALYPILDLLGAAEAYNILVSKALIYQIGFDEGGVVCAFNRKGTITTSLIDSAENWSEGVLP